MASALLLMPLLVSLEVGNDWNVAHLPALAIIAYCSGHLAFLAGLAKQRLVSLTFWLFSYVFMGLVPWIQLSRGFPRELVVPEDGILKGAIIVLVGLVAFDLGGALVRKNKGSNLRPKSLEEASNGSFFMVFGSVALLILVVPMVGGLELFFLPRSVKFAELQSQFAQPVLLIIERLATVPIVVAAVAATLVWIKKRKYGFVVGWPWRVMVFATWVGALVLNNPIGTPRYRVGLVILALVFVVPWGRLRNGAFIIAAMMGLILVFPLASAFRHSLDVEFGAKVVNFRPLDNLSESGDFDAFQQLVNVQHITDVRGLRFGEQAVGAVLFWVPRSVWASKPINTGNWAAKELGYSHTNLSSPLWAEFYVDGGWLLVGLGFVLYGYMVTRLDLRHRYAEAERGISLVEVFVPLYAGFQIFLLRGSLLPAVANFAPFVVTIGGLWLFARRINVR